MKEGFRYVLQAGTRMACAHVATMTGSNVAPAVTAEMNAMFPADTLTKKKTRDTLKSSESEDQRSAKR